MVKRFGSVFLDPTEPKLQYSVNSVRFGRTLYMFLEFAKICFREKCSQVPISECNPITRKVCENITKQKPIHTPRQVCVDEPKTHCVDITKQVPGQICQPITVPKCTGKEYALKK